MTAEKAVEVQSLKLARQGTFFGKRFVPLTTRQAETEKIWERFLEDTLGPELKPEEMEALERTMKKFKGVSDLKLENPYFWESWAPTWAEYSRKSLDRGFRLLNRIGRLEGHPRILSLGAGSCWQEVFLSQYCCPESRVFCLDFSKPMIKQGVRLAGKRGVAHIHFAVGKVEDIPLKKGQADLVISIHLLDLIPDPPRVLGEIRRVLSSETEGGYFFLFPLKPRDVLSTKAAVWERMILEAGLRRPRMYCLRGRNYKGQTLRLLVLTDRQGNPS
jgi:SAM-dependent methyltransferase